jgi:hypothetical protein
LVEARGRTGQRGFARFADLAAQGRGLADQIAAVADAELAARPGLLRRWFEEGKARDRSTLDSRQVGVIGLVARVLGLAELLGREGMDHARLQARRREGALHDTVVTTGSLDGDPEIMQFVGRQCLTELDEGLVQRNAVLLDRGWGYHDSTEEVAEHPHGCGPWHKRR